MFVPGITVTLPTLSTVRLDVLLRKPMPAP